MERSVVVGRDSAQMIGLLLPFEETLVKNPRSCPPPIETEEAARLSDGLGDDLSLHTFTNLPPLLTTRGSESTGSTKYEGPHQQAPTGYAPQHIIRRAGISPKVVFIHEEHRCRLPGSHGEMRVRARLIGENEHSSGAEVPIGLVQTPPI